jgi:WhiB family redox-sensing transcriptional regulator
VSFIPEEWMEDSKCLTLTVDEADRLFFPPDTNANWPAKRFCHGKTDDKPCPVIGECLSYAIRTDTNFGVWGGESPRDRRKMADRAAAAI